MLACSCLSVLAARTSLRRLHRRGWTRRLSSLAWQLYSFVSFCRQVLLPSGPRSVRSFPSVPCRPKAPCTRHCTVAVPRHLGSTQLCVHLLRSVLCRPRRPLNLALCLSVLSRWCPWLLLRPLGLSARGRLLLHLLLHPRPPLGFLRVRLLALVVGNRALTDPPPAASGPGGVLASDSYASSLPSPGAFPGLWATVGDMSTGAEMVDQLSRLRPDTRDRIVQLCNRMGSPPLPKAPKSSFPPARPASAVPKADARRVQTDALGFPLPAVPDPTEPTVVAKTPSIRAARPTVVHPPPCLVQCPTPGCFNQCGRPVYGRGHRNHFCRVCHRLHR